MRSLLATGFMALVTSLLLATSAAAARPASDTELREMSAFSSPPSARGFREWGLISIRNPHYGLVLVNLNSPTGVAPTSNPLAAYLFHKPASPHPRQWTFLAQTLLRGKDINAWELRHLCGIVRRNARDLAPRACGR